MDIGLFRGILTAVMLAFFVGIWIWAWLPGRKQAFKEAANLPLADEEDQE